MTAMARGARTGEAKLVSFEFAKNVAEIITYIETAVVPAMEGKGVLKGTNSAD